MMKATVQPEHNEQLGSKVEVDSPGGASELVSFASSFSSCSAKAKGMKPLDSDFKPGGAA
jgi:hypothetical protein